MSLGKLKRSLHREFTRNPTKSCTLLALLPIAGYFIGPLVWKQLPFAKASSATPVASFVAAEVATLATVPTSSGQQSLPRWQEVAQWIEQDARMKSSPTVSQRDPFHLAAKVASPPSDVEPQTQPQAPSAASMRPEDCGLELTATIVGPAKRLATISGRLYAENSRVRFGNSNRSADEPPADDDAFELKTVAKNFVVLERHGELFQLSIARGADK